MERSNAWYAHTMHAGDCLVTVLLTDAVLLQLSWNFICCSIMSCCTVFFSRDQLAAAAGAAVSAAAKSPVVNSVFTDTLVHA